MFVIELKQCNHIKIFRKLMFLNKEFNITAEPFKSLLKKIKTK